MGHVGVGLFADGQLKTLTWVRTAVPLAATQVGRFTLIAL